ncbi:MAG: ATP synthase F0 subunit B [Firmicutes bacterium]|nr:ATP synthase F0 subunit B [Bacillota bacterium]
MDFEALGLTWQSMVFHAVTLVILIVVLWWALYKPIKKIMEDRQAKLKEVGDLIPRLKEEAEQTKLEYEKLLEDTKAEAARVALESETTAKAKAASLIEDARLKSEVLMVNAHKECMVEKTRVMNDFKEKAVDLVIDISSKVIEREVSARDNKKYIDECLTKWEKE